jgi:hypothetical protein
MVAPIKATKKVALGRDTWWIIPALASATSPAVTDTLEPTTFSIPTFRFALDPQAAAGANDKKAWALLKDGFTGFIVRRQNIVNSISDAAVAGQFVDNAPIIGSVGTPKVTGTGADAIYVFDVDFGITGIPTFNVACV